MSTPSKIPIRNIYYLLSYAWDDYSAGDWEALRSEECPDLANLFAVVLSEAIRRLIRHDGLHREYVPRTDELAVLRGKVDFAAGIKRQTQRSGRAVCRFDELDHDVLHNQILRATIEILLKAEGLEAPNRERLLGCKRWFARVSTISLRASLFPRVQIAGNARQYRFLLNLCELIFHSLLPTEEL